jgi:hypothetical protein
MILSYILRLWITALWLGAAIATPSMSPTSPNSQQLFIPKTSNAQGGGYQAPLRDNDEETIDGTYIIRLFPGHTFEEHCRIIGKDGKDPTDFHVDLDMLHFFPNAIGYRCDHVSEEVLHKIRADPGVEEVYCISVKGGDLE